MILLLADIPLVGFSREEKRKIERYMKGNGITEYTFAFVQEVADILGCDIGTMIEPGGKIKLIKL